MLGCDVGGIPDIILEGLFGMPGPWGIPCLLLGCPGPPGIGLVGMLFCKELGTPCWPGSILCDIPDGIPGLP